MNVKDYYEEISKNRDLSSFNEINSEFEIDSIEKGNFARQIAEKIVEKTEKFRKVLEDFLHSDGSSIAVLMEIKGMDEKDKDMITSLYKELTIIERNSLLVDLDDHEDALLDFIEKSLKQWNSIKPNLRKIILKAKESWKDNSDDDTKLRYLG